MSQLDDAEGLAKNIKEVRETIAEAALRARRDPQEVTLVAVSKTVAAERVALAFRLGIADFGENRVQEAAEKIPRVEALYNADLRPKWHLVGHLQTNKVREALGLFDTVQSVDSLHLAQRLNAEAGRVGRKVQVLLEVNVGNEPQKNGFRREELEAAAREIANLPHVEIQGLMTVAPLVTDPEEIRPVFRGLRELRDKLRDTVPDVNWQHLSMGMTDDYPVAIEEEATIVRLGRAIFGARG